jgi:hypothetical protein
LLDQEQELDKQLQDLEEEEKRQNAEIEKLAKEH